MNGKTIAHYEKILPEVAKHSSEMERRADEAERETEKLKKVEYMERHIGETYLGVILRCDRVGLLCGAAEHGGGSCACDDPDRRLLPLQ